MLCPTVLDFENIVSCSTVTCLLVTSHPNSFVYDPQNPMHLRRSCVAFLHISILIFNGLTSPYQMHIMSSVIQTFHCSDRTNQIAIVSGKAISIFNVFKETVIHIRLQQYQWKTYPPTTYTSSHSYHNYDP